MVITDSNIYVSFEHWYGVVYKFDNSVHFAVVSDYDFYHKFYCGYVHNGKLYATSSHFFSSRLEAWKEVLDFLGGNSLLGTCYSDADVVKSDTFREFRKYLNLEEKNEITCVHGV